MALELERGPRPPPLQTAEGFSRRFLLAQWHAEVLRTHPGVTLLWRGSFSALHLHAHRVFKRLPPIGHHAFSLLPKRPRVPGGRDSRRIRQGICRPHSVEKWLYPRTHNPRPIHVRQDIADWLLPGLKGRDLLFVTLTR